MVSTTSTSITSLCSHRGVGPRDRGCAPSGPRRRPPRVPHSHLREATVDYPNTILAAESLETEKMVDGMDFGELCSEFECTSSPSVEASARQLARDILELRQGNRALGSYSISVKYKDPLRSFVGRERYKRPLWATYALENPKVTVQEMEMLSTSTLIIRWTVQGKARNFESIDVITRVNSLFTMNQISGQVLEHEECWDVSSSSPTSQWYFWISRVTFSAVEALKDTTDITKNSADLSFGRDNSIIYPDPSGDPTKFFVTDDGFQRDAYQIALFLAVMYLVVQFLRLTL